jgi:hypothetical protein
MIPNKFLGLIFKINQIKREEKRREEKRREEKVIR